MEFNEQDLKVDQVLTHRLGSTFDTPIYIAPLGDIQWNGDKNEIWVDGLKDYIAEAMELGAWFIGMGDYVDFASPSNRSALAGIKKYDSTENNLDSIALERQMEVYDKFLRPTKGRWLGMLEGHHYWEYSTGGTSDTRLCELLGAPFLGKAAIVRLAVTCFSNRKLTYNIWAHHGEGGGSESAMVLRMKRIAQYWERIDLFLMGHATKKPVTPIPRIEPDFKKVTRLRHRDVYLVGTGGWLKGYVEGRTRKGRASGTYVEERMLDPVSLGAPLIRLTPTRWERGGLSTSKIMTKVIV